MRNLNFKVAIKNKFLISMSFFKKKIKLHIRTNWGQKSNSTCFDVGMEIPFHFHPRFFFCPQNLFSLPYLYKLGCYLSILRRFSLNQAILLPCHVFFYELLQDFYKNPGWRSNLLLYFVCFIRTSLFTCLYLELIFL